MKHFVSVVILCLTPILLAACYKLHPVAYIPKDISSSGFTAKKLSQVSVSTSNDGNIDGIFDADAYRIALEQVLKKAGLFKKDELNGLTLEANITKLYTTKVGFEMTVALNVRYQVTEKSGRKLFTEEVKTEEKAPPSEAFTGGQRAYNAWDRARQNHMNVLVGKLGMFLAQ